MCGIWLYISTNGNKTTSPNFFDAFMKLQSRGPERSRYVILNKKGIHIGFHRLSIMDPTVKGDQPFVIETPDGRTLYIFCNGEIFNFKELAQKFKLDLTSGSDCEVIGHIYEMIGVDGLCHELQGEYAFVICETSEDGETKIVAGRDLTGVRPMFVSYTSDGICFSSEAKGSPFLSSSMYDIHQFPQASHLTLLTSQMSDFLKRPQSFYTKYEDISTIVPTIFNLDEAVGKCREQFHISSKRKIFADRALGCFLSGGLDSSKTFAELHEARTSLPKDRQKDIVSFSGGLLGSTDEPYAKLMAESKGAKYYVINYGDVETSSKIRYHTGDRHYHIRFTEEEFINAVPEVIYAIESFDITTVRASVGQYLLSKWVTTYTDIKVLMLGDGSDELTGGYMYFHRAPSAIELHKENVRLLQNIHYYDVLRADRGVAANGLEARVPFLDEEFIRLYLTIDPTLRMPLYGVEKWLLREATKGLIPEEIRMRRKEAFSDGVSSSTRSWYKILQESIETKYSDEELITAQRTYKHLPPTSKEALHYRKIFEQYFGTGKVCELIPQYWLPRWVGDVKEPSARVLSAYSESKGTC